MNFLDTTSSTGPVGAGTPSQQLSPVIVPPPVVRTTWRQRTRAWFKKTKQPPWRWVVGILVLLIIIVLGGSLFFLQAAINAAQEGKNAAQEAGQSLQQREIRDALAQGQQAVEYIQEAQTNIKRAWVLRFLPWIGTQVRAFEQLADAGVAVGNSGSRILTWVEELPWDKTAEEAQQLPREERQKIILHLIEMPSLLMDLDQDIDRAQSELSDLPTTGVTGQILQAAKTMRSNLKTLKDLIAPYRPVAEVMPRVTGSSDQPKAYLWLLFNNDEIRPTGGYISAYAYTVFRHGKLEEFFSDNAINLDKNIKGPGRRAPAPIQRYDIDHNHGPVWLFHDAAWSPDYPTALQDITALFIEQNRQQGKTIPPLFGVFAITPTFIGKFLRLTGNIQLYKYNISPQNVVDVLEIDSDRGFRERRLSEKDRKQLIFDLGVEMLRRLSAKEIVPTWLDNIKIFQEGLNERHMLLWHNDQTLQDKVRERGWDGIVKQTNGDYLQLSDANLGSFKSDIGVERSLTYNLVEVNGEWRAKVTVRYQNNNSLIWKTRPTYRTYTRLYVPAGSRLIRATGFDTKVETTQEVGKGAFGGFMAIPIGQTRVVTWEYVLPTNFSLSGLTGGQYNLTIQKQPGAKILPVALDLNFARPVRSDLLGKSQILEPGRRYRATTQLATDQEFKLGF